MGTSALTISVDQQTENGRIMFYPTFNRTPSSEESALFNSFRVNLSRGGNRPYRFDTLQNHLDGANWVDGKGVHSESSRKEYVKRVLSDISTQWAGFKGAVAEAKKAAIANSARKTVFTGS